MSEVELCDVEAQITILGDIKEYITRVYPECNADELLKDKTHIVEKSDMVCRDLNDLYVNRDKYNLHWAFKQANESIIIRQEKFGEKIKEKIPNIKEIFASSSQSTKMRIKKMQNAFNFLSFLVSFIDIAVSVALIVLVTILSQRIESLIESVVLNIVFIAIIALAKVSLDRFLIIPRIDAWGWRRYLKAIEVMKSKSVMLISIAIIIEDAVRKNKDRETIIELFLRNFDSSKRSMRREIDHVERLLTIHRQTN